MSDFTPEKLGKRIKELRKAAGFTQDELADKAEVSYSSIAKLEQGKIDNPSFFTILRLSELLETSVDQILGLTSKTSPVSSGMPTDGISTVVFDIHGVLVCNWQHIYVDLAERTNVDPHHAEEVFWQHENRVADGTISVNDFERVFAADLNADPNDIKYPEVYSAAVEAFQPAHELLLELNKTYDIAILSNIFPDFEQLLFKKHCLPLREEAYKAVLLSYRMKKIKPSEAVYELAESNLGVPSSLLFLDDTEANIEAAKARGWHGVVYDQNDWRTSHDQIQSILQGQSQT